MNPAPILPLISTSDLDKIDVASGPFSVVAVRLRVDFGEHARSILVDMKRSGHLQRRLKVGWRYLAPRKVAGEIF
ncbi:hypothetical protein [Bradyrhizobium sp. CSA207]|uniref:hypothetical protein n=1 Tax=Bradyrhizobium sp. CSA207 TaxID=2698826 RepID=UPI0023AF3A62|nr:hypothetical protein [Bradyrhizobium sp. CSA207]